MRGCKTVRQSGLRRVTTLRRMRRWLAILMLVLLPAQFSWAVVGQYCAHETGAQTRHLGHHSHERDHGDATPVQAGELPDGDASPWDAAGGGHPDCEYCHLACGVVVPVPSAGAAPTASAGLPAASVPAVGRHIADQPERPQWVDSRTPV